MAEMRNYQTVLCLRFRYGSVLFARFAVFENAVHIHSCFNALVRTLSSMRIVLGIFAHYWQYTDDSGDNASLFVIDPSFQNVLAESEMREYLSLSWHIHDRFQVLTVRDIFA